MPETIKLYKNYITRDEYNEKVEKYKLYKPVLKIIEMCKEILGVKNFVDVFEISSVRIDNKRRSSYNIVGIGGHFNDGKNHGLKPLVNNDIGYFYESKCIVELENQYSKDFDLFLQQLGYEEREWNRKYYTEYYRPSKKMPSVSEAFKVTVRDSKELLDEIKYYKNNNIIVDVISDTEIENKYKDTDDMLKEVEEYLQNKEN